MFFNSKLSKNTTTTALDNGEIFVLSLRFSLVEYENVVS